MFNLFKSNKEKEDSSLAAQVKAYSERPEIKKALEELFLEDSIKQMKGNSLLEDKIIRRTVKRDVPEDVVTEDNDDSYVKQETAPMYWTILHADSKGGMLVGIYSIDEQERIQKMVAEIKEKRAAMLRAAPTLATATIKAELLSRLIKDDKQTRVKPLRSLLYGNNIEVIPPKSELEKTWNRRKSEPEEKTTKRTIKRTTTIVEEIITEDND
jgi:ribosomal protein L23